VIGISFASIQSVIREERPDGIPTQGREVARERREYDHLRLRWGAHLAEVQQAAERFLDVVHLGDGVVDAIAANARYSEGWTLVPLREPRHEVECGGDVAASGKIRKGAVGVSVDLVARLRHEAPRFESGALPVVKLVEHCLHWGPTFLLLRRRIV
jgi:hypothetical protein